MSFSRLFKLDLKLYHRYRIYYLIAGIVLVYTLILRQIPSYLSDTAGTMLIFFDPSLVGFMFLGALILFERKDGSLNALSVTPASLDSYMWSKVISMTILALISGISIAILAFGYSDRYIFIAVGILLTSLVYTLLGFASVSKYKRLDSYFSMVFLVMAVSMLPLLDFFQIFESDLFYIIPSYSSIELIYAGFVETEIVNILFYSVYLIVWIFISFYLARKRFYKHIVTEGEI